MTALRRTLPYLRPYRWVVFFMFITSVLPVAMELIVPSALRGIIDRGILQSDMDAIVRNTTVMLLSALVGIAATLGQGVCRARLSQGLAYDLRNELFAHIQTFSFANRDHMQTGGLMTRLSSDVDMMRMFFSAGVALLLRASFMILGSLVLMFSIDSQLSLVMWILLPLAGLMIWYVMHLAQPLFTGVQERLEKLNNIVQENLAGVQVVKAFVRERHEIGRFMDVNWIFTAQNIKVNRLTAGVVPVLTLLTNLGIVAIVWFGGRDTIGGRISVGNLIAFNNYLLIGMAPLLLLGNILTMVSRAEASAGRIWEILDTLPAVRPAARPHLPDEMRGEVSFGGVSFHYNGAGIHVSGQDGRQRAGGRDVLNDVSFTAKPGQRVALLGATGSGKSSLVNLIPRFYDADSGQIQIDGHDIQEWDLAALRQGIGVVLQQTTLFSGTIRENIAYGRPNASQDEVIQAAIAAQAHYFIESMPEGYDSLVEERGVNLSGGQKQRLAIARALLIRPKILILDDSTSAVDMETEAEIQAALESMDQEFTVFIVAQRINSVLGADTILILDRGRIVARGDHEELLASNTIYQEIVRSQLGDGAASGGRS